MLVKLFFSLLFCKLAQGVVHEAFTGRLISEELYHEFEDAGVLDYCTTDIKLPCDPNEPRRLDGSCNNLEQPTFGTFHTPLMRLLPADFVTEDQPATTTKSGRPKRLPRQIRTMALTEGKAKDPQYTQLLSAAAATLFIDCGSIHDSFNYLNQTTYCCTEKGKTDHMCTPNFVPHDDPVHRFSGIRCLNLTRPLSFQSHGCVAKNSGLDRIESNTATLDLSHIYQSGKPAPVIRLNVSGMLTFDVDDGTTWPPHDGPNNQKCLLNQPESGETRCLGPVLASILPASLYTVLSWRMHNVIATSLAEINPCWSDDRLFHTARDINIAISNQINFYELLPILIGRKRLEESGIISSHPGFRETYSKDVLPQISLEYFYCMRWFHIVQEGAMKMYDENNIYLKQEPAVNISLRIGYLAKDKNFANIMRGTFLQPGGGNDRVVDPDISEMGLGGLQRSADLTTSDLAKGRLFGFPPYIKYREFCTGRTYKTWRDLTDVIEWNKIEMLQEMYEGVDEVDFMVGLWLEGPVKGGYVTPTVACVMEDQLLRTVKGDRHWYESADRPNAFTYEQLQEIRKATTATFICETVHEIRSIQPQAFKRVSSKNRLVSCDQITKWDLNAWRDPACYRRNDYFQHDHNMPPSWDEHRI